LEKRRLFDLLCETLRMTPEQLRDMQQRLNAGSLPDREDTPQPDSARSVAAPAAPVQAGSQPPGTTSPGEARVTWFPPEPPPVKKPSSSKKKAGQIEWGGMDKSGLPEPNTLVGVEDAFDHTPLQAGEKVAFCKLDRVAYHLGTWKFLRTENQGRCCICGRENVFAFITLPGLPPDRPLHPLSQPPGLLRPGDQIISLKDVPGYVNKAVIVQDYVYEVYKTRSKGTYFIRFEPRGPYEPVFGGFKVVIFARYENAWNQAGLSIKDYQGHHLRVRGVIQQHPEWGIEILVNSPRVIEIVENPKPDQAGQL
jgi:hypothetical protein